MGNHSSARGQQGRNPNAGIGAGWRQPSDGMWVDRSLKLRQRRGEYNVPHSDPPHTLLIL
jgi:hypothetical protein